MTAWILSLTGLDGGKLLYPFCWSPPPSLLSLALIGVGLTMMAKSERKKDVA